MKRSCLILTFLFSLLANAGVGGIGGGTSRFVSNDELLILQKSKQLDVAIPQVYFTTYSSGTYFVSVDSLCRTGENIEPVTPLLAVKFNESDGAHGPQFSEVALVAGQQVVTGQMQSINFEIQVYKKVSERAASLRRVHLDTVRYQIPQCRPKEYGRSL